MGGHALQHDPNILQRSTCSSTLSHSHADVIRYPDLLNADLVFAWQVLDVLAEVAFEAEFLNSRIEKERRAVMAEAQMMNTIEYRVDCQLLQYLHEENDLGFRFPIGKMEQVLHTCTTLTLRLYCEWHALQLTHVLQHLLLTRNS